MDARAAALSALVQFQVTDTTVAEALHRIADITREAVPAADVVGMTMMGDDGRPTTAVFTDPTSPQIDEAQYGEGKGPCLDAWRYNSVLRVPRVEDVAHEYPGFATACLERGVHSTLSLPMRAGDAAMGAMNLYSQRSDGFTDGDESLAGDLAAAGATVLVNVSAYWTAFELSAQLNEAMASRAVIEQAKGILMAHQPDMTPDQAFEVLRAASQRENTKLRDVAKRIVSRRAAGGADRGSS